MLLKNITELNPEILKSIIKDTEPKRSELVKLYNRYKNLKINGVPIYQRKYYIAGEEQTDKINNKIGNDFFSEIIDMKTGFIAGVPIIYSLDKDNYSEADYEKNIDTIYEWKNVNMSEESDVELIKLAAISGYAGRLMYLDTVNELPVVRIMNMLPSELIFVGNSIEEPDYTIRVYDAISYKLNGEEITTTHVEVYDKSYITYFVMDKKGNYISEKESVLHMFDFNPLIGLSNNNEYIGDAEPVLSLIDAYDRTLSDVDSELEQFRLAYLAITGATITDEILERAKRMGAFSLPDGSSMAFVTKDIDDNIVEHHLDRIERNIYRFSKTPNMNDIEFGGNVTGVAMKYKFRSFEFKCKIMELKIKKFLREQFKILSSIWDKTQKANIDYLDVDFVFTRNYPQNLIEEAQLLQTLKGLVSENTALGLVSFVQDVDKEIEALDKEKEINLDRFMERQGPDEEEEEETE